MEPFMELEMQGFKYLSRQSIIDNRKLLYSVPDIYSAFSTKLANHLAGRVQFHYSFNNQPVANTEELSVLCETCLRNEYRSYAESGLIGVTTSREERLDEAREKRKLELERGLTTGNQVIENSYGEDDEIEDDITYYEIDSNTGKSKKIIKKGKIKRKINRRIAEEDFDEIKDYLEETEDDMRPICTDLTMVDLWYKEHRDPAKWQWRVFQPSERTFGLDLSWLCFTNLHTKFYNYRELKHIKIHMIDPIDPETGELRCIISRCRDAVKQERYTQYCAEMAMRINACPLMPLEHVPTDPKNQDVAGMGEQDGLTGGATSAYDATKTIQLRNENQRTGYDPVAEVVKTMTRIDNTNYNVNTFMSSIFALPENKKVSSFTSPVEPTHTMDYKLHVKQLIFAQFGMPYQLALAYAPLQGGKSISQGGAGGAQSQKTTTMPATMYAQSCKVERRFMINILQELLDQMTDLYRKVEMPHAPHHARILISIPGIPPDEQITQDYLLGIINFPSLVDMKCALHDYRLDQCNTINQREIDVKELNGVKEEKKENEGPKKKKKKSS